MNGFHGEFYANRWFQTGSRIGADWEGLCTSHPPGGAEVCESEAGEGIGFAYGFGVREARLLPLRRASAWRVKSERHDSPTRHFDLVREMKNPYNHRLPLVESAKQRGIKSTAQLLATTMPTVRKWLRRYQQRGPTGLTQARALRSSCALRPFRLRRDANLREPLHWRHANSIMAGELSWSSSRWRRMHPVSSPTLRPARREIDVHYICARKQNCASRRPSTRIRF